MLKMSDPILQTMTHTHTHTHTQTMINPSLRTGFYLSDWDVIEEFAS